MNTENLKIIIDLVSKLGEGARATFLWYLAYNMASDILVCVTFVAVPVATVKAIFAGISKLKEHDRN